MRRFIALPAAMFLSVALAGTAFAAFCGNDSKKDGSGQKVVLWVDLSTSPPTETILEGANAAGRMTGAFADVHLDFNGDDVADCTINDTYLISSHSGHAAPGQDDGGLAVNPAVHKVGNPGGDSGVGFAELAGSCF